MDNEIGIAGYDLYRRDRGNETNGVGVCLYVKSQLNFILRSDLAVDGIEALWGELIIGKGNCSLLLSTGHHRPPYLITILC